MKIQSQPASEFSSDAIATLERIRDTRQPVALRHNGRDVAVVVDIESYQSLLSELDLLRDVQVGLADADQGRVVPHEEVRQLLLQRYAE